VAQTWAQTLHLMLALRAAGLTLSAEEPRDAQDVLHPAAALPDGVRSLPSLLRRLSTLPADQGVFLRVVLQTLLRTSRHYTLPTHGEQAFAVAGPAAGTRPVHHPEPAP